MKLRNIYIIAAAVVVLITPAVLFLYFNSPPAGTETEVFSVDHGESVASVGRHLQTANHIRSSLFFVSMVRVLGKTQIIKSGEYEFRKNLKTMDIIDILARGEVITIRFTVPEGLHMRQIADLLQEKGIFKAESFLAACRDESILERYSIPFDSAEGFLFPDTYIIAKGLSAESVVEIMIQRFISNMKNSGLYEFLEEDIGRIVIVASLIEKEAKIDDERPIIAAVFYNRLQADKRLESCATVQYILGETKERLLYSDLRIKSPYNTYLNTGLPPGPISNPGLKSLKAAIFPADVDYLFFVSKHDGSHYFSTTYAEHLDAIERYKPDTIGHLS